MQDRAVSRPQDCSDELGLGGAGALGGNEDEEGDEGGEGGIDDEEGEDSIDSEEVANDGNDAGEDRSVSNPPRAILFASPVRNSRVSQKRSSAAKSVASRSVASKSVTSRSDSMQSAKRSKRDLTGEAFARYVASQEKIVDHLIVKKSGGKNTKWADKMEQLDFKNRQLEYKANLWKTFRTMKGHMSDEDIVAQFPDMKGFVASYHKRNTPSSRDGSDNESTD
jgi:hypothetical protein